MLAVVKSPVVWFTNAPAELTFKKSGILTAKAVASQLFIAFDAADRPSNNETLKLKLAGNAFVNFTFKTTPSVNVNTELTAYASGTDSAYFAALAKEIYRHPDIKEKFEVTFLGSASGSGLSIIQFKARVKGADYSLTIDNTSTVGYDTDATKAVEGVDAVAPDNYKLVLSLDILDNIDEPATRRISQIEATGIVDYDKDEVLITFHDIPALIKHTNAPDIPLNPYRPGIYSNGVSKVKWEVYESYDGATIPAVIQRDSNVYEVEPFIYAFNAGVPLTHYPYEQSYSQFLQAAGHTSFWSLVKDRTKVVSRNQPEWLTIWLSKGDYTFYLTVTYKDGTTAEKTIDYTAPVEHLYYLPSGYLQNELSELNTDDKEEVSYTFHIETVTNVYSETFTYILDQRLFNSERFFVYRNSIGALDTLRFVGLNDFTVKRAGASDIHALTSDTRMNKGTIETVYSSRDEILTMRTGWLLDRDEKEFLLDFLNSTWIAEFLQPITEDTEEIAQQQYRATVVAQDSLDMWQDDTGLWAAEFKMQYAHTETRFAAYAPAEEPFFEDEIEFTIEVTSITGGSPDFGLDATGTLADAVMNGAPLSSMVVPGTGVWVFKLRGYDITALSITPADIEGKITFTRLRGILLESISVTGLDLEADYLYKRLEHLLSLTDLTLITANDPGLDTNTLLAACIKLYNTYHNLAYIDIETTVPDDTGAELVAELQDYGLTVTTG